MGAGCDCHPRCDFCCADLYESLECPTSFGQNSLQLLTLGIFDTAKLLQFFLFYRNVRGFISGCSGQRNWLVYFLCGEDNCCICFFSAFLFYLSVASELLLGVQLCHVFVLLPYLWQPVFPLMLKIEYVVNVYFWKWHPVDFFKYLWKTAT